MIDEGDVVGSFNRLRFREEANLKDGFALQNGLLASLGSDAVIRSS
jgi:hypothetical protein